MRQLVIVIITALVVCVSNVYASNNELLIRKDVQLIEGGREFKIVVNDERLYPISYKDILYVPLRAIADLYGFIYDIGSDNKIEINISNEKSSNSYNLINLASVSNNLLEEVTDIGMLLNINNIDNNIYNYRLLKNIETGNIFIELIMNNEVENKALNLWVTALSNEPLAVVPLNHGVPLMLNITSYYKEDGILEIKILDRDENTYYTHLSDGAKAQSIYKLN